MSSWKHPAILAALICLASLMPAAGCSSRDIPLPLPVEPVLKTEVTGGHAVGSTPGVFGVSGDGAASYKIPLWVPAGRAGMQPDLSLQYNSRGGDGMLGVGWSLAGLPEIARCQKTIASDGYAAPVRFDSTDPFCLDGQRLILVGGTSGADGAEYRTERDSFIKIVAHAPDALGPTSFKAYLKDGRILTFGLNGSDRTPTLQVRRVSSVAPPATASIFTGPNIVTQKQEVRLAWAVGVVEDRAGNTMRVTYNHPTIIPPPGLPGFAQMLYPRQIDYTGSSNPANAGVGLRSVRFVYSGLASPAGESFGYISGVPWWNAQRLERIDMYGPNPDSPQLLRSYRLTYGSPTVTRRLLLESLTELDGADVPLGSTTFDWEKGSLGYGVSDTGINDISKDPRYRWLEVFDFNGDGRSDLLYIPQNSPTGDYYIRLSDGTKFGPPVDTGISYAKSGHPPLSINYNNSGRDDLLVYVDRYPPKPNAPFVDRPDTPCVARTIGLAGNVNHPAFILGPCFPGRRALGGDLNGDGLSDVLTYVPGNQASWRYQLNRPPGGQLSAPATFTGPSETVPTLATPNKWELNVADVDGDGASELIGYRPNSSDTRRADFELGRAPRNPADRFIQGTLYTGVNYFFGDFNGDGLLDALAWNNDGKHVSTFLNTGNGYSNNIDSAVGSETIPPNNKIDSGIRVFDYDGDGRADLLLRADAGPESRRPHYRDALNRKLSEASGQPDISDFGCRQWPCPASRHQR